MLDYEISANGRSASVEIFDCFTGCTVKRRTFRGPLHYLRACLWARRNYK